MEKNAVKLAKMVGYKSAGTVEYLYDYRSKEGEKEKTYLHVNAPSLKPKRIMRVYCKFRAVNKNYDLSMKIY